MVHQMILSKTRTGASFKGLVAYVLAPEKRPVILESRGVRESKEKMIADFNSGRLLNPKLGKCVWHTSLSFQDNIDDAKMLAISKDWMEQMGLIQTQWVVVAHNDTNHKHAHLIINRVADDGHSLSDQHSWKRSMRICRELEKKYSLTPMVERFREKTAIEHSLSKANLAGRDRFKMEVDLAVRECLNSARDLHEFEMYMKEKKIACEFKRNKDGSLRGLTFTQGTVRIKASDVNRYYSVKHLERYFERKQQTQAGKAAQAALSSAKIGLQKTKESYDKVLTESKYDEGVFKIDEMLNATKKNYGRRI